MADDNVVVSCSDMFVSRYSRANECGAARMIVSSLNPTGAVLTNH